MTQSGPAPRAANVRPAVAAFVSYAVITAAMTYPLIRVASSAVSRPFADPFLNAWILWWNTQQWPLTDAWWNAPMFYPSTGAMGLSELLLGLLPMTAPIQWLFHNPLLAYNVAVLLSFPLCGIGAYALAFELTGRHDAAWLAGLAFAFSPYRANEFGHLQMLSYFWAPVVLLALHRYVRDRNVRWLAVFAIAWLLQALCNGHAILQLPVLIALWILWFARTAREFVPIGLAWACGSLPLVPILLKYREIQGSLHLRRGITDIVNLSADLASFLSAAPELVVWGPRLLSNRLPGLFPGVTILVVLLVAIVTWKQPAQKPSKLSVERAVLGMVALACLGVAGSELLIGPWKFGPLSVGQAYKPFSIAVVAAFAFVARGPVSRQLWHTRSLTGFYLAAMICMYVLAAGPAPHALGKQILYKAPYAWFMAFPGFDSIRVPARFVMLATLCMAVVVAFAFARWSAERNNWRRPIWIALSIGLLTDGWFTQRFVPAPGSPGETWAGVAGVVELPLGDPDRDAMALYRSITHGVPLLNGYSGYFAPQYPALKDALSTGTLAAINEFTTYGPIGIAIDRSDPAHGPVEESVARLDGVKPVHMSPQWATFVLPRSVRVNRPAGARLPITRVRANRKAEDVWRLLDRNIETAWGSGTSQNGDEEIVIDLEGIRTVGQIVLRLGPNSFGFPRDLAVDTSVDGVHWSQAWRGRPVVETVRAALENPGDVPVSIDIGSTTAEFVRLRQLGLEPAIPWWIAELSIHEPGGER